MTDREMEEIVREAKERKGKIDKEREKRVMERETERGSNRERERK